MFNIIILSNIIKLGSFDKSVLNTIILQDYWTATEATDFTSIEKEVLLSLYRNENLYIEGYELWDH